MRAANDGDYGRSSQRHDPFPHQRHDFNVTDAWARVHFHRQCSRCCCVKLDWRSSVDRSHHRQSGSCSVGVVDSLTDALSFCPTCYDTESIIQCDALRFPCVDSSRFAERLGSPVNVLGTIVFCVKGRLMCLLCTQARAHQLKADQRLPLRDGQRYPMTVLFHSCTEHVDSVTHASG